MRLLRRDSEESVTRRLVEAGAPRGTADAVVATLLGCGLSPGEVREWLSHPELAYPLPPDGTALAAIGQGDAERVLAAAEDYAAALPEERLIARLFWGDLEAARRLTGGGDPQRTQVVAGIARELLRRLRKPELVCNVGQTILPGDGRRIVDRLAAGEAEAVAAELRDGRIDPRALERNGELLFTGW